MIVRARRHGDARHDGERTGDALTYRFTGRLAGDTLSGLVDLGEYGTARWSARRAAPANPGLAQ